MADSLHPTPFAEKLAAELRSLHDRREREPLSGDDETRYAELWAWWQSGATGAVASPAAEPRDDASVPEEWRAAFAQEAPASHPDAAPEAADDLAREWEEWQGRQASGDPFASVPAADGNDGFAPSHEEVMAARAEELDAGTSLAELGAADGDDAGTAPEPPRLAPTKPAAADAARPRGSQRVVIHLLDGQVRRGETSALELDGDTFEYVAQSGAAESVRRENVRAVFFMRSPDAAAPQPAGRAVKVTFRDGRELAGTSADHEELSDSFTLVPADPHTNAALVWIARSAVRQVTPA